MSAEKVRNTDIERAIIQLDNAIYNYIAWHNQILRTITCQLPADKQDIDDYAHTQCNLGQWYYNCTIPQLLKHPGFIALGDSHSYVHKIAKELLFASLNNQKISTYDYDRFANAVERLQLEITSLKHELENSLYKRDLLTGAINKSDVIPILREIYDLSKTKSMHCALIMVDIDKLDEINKKYGNSAGDEVLSVISRYLMQNTRGYDKVFRYAGEEFLLCIINVDAITAYDKAEELRKGLTNVNITLADGANIGMTASFGVSILDTNISLDENIEHATTAVKNAKNSGCNCVVILEEGQGKRT